MSPAPVIIALLNLVQAIVIWGPSSTCRATSCSASSGASLSMSKNPRGKREDGAGESWFTGASCSSCRRDRCNTFKCNSTEPHIIRNDYVDGKFSFLLATDPPVNNLLERTGRDSRCASRGDVYNADGRPALRRRGTFSKTEAEYSDEGPGQGRHGLHYRKDAGPRMVVK